MSKAKREMVRGLSAAHVIGALREMYPTREYAFFEQAASGVGWQARRWSDAIAMSLWPSRGLNLFGFEVKVSRGDWKKELESPEKADAIAAYCDFWYIAAPRGLIEVAELPPTWGLVEVDEASKGRIAKTALKLDAKPLDRQFIAALLRRQSDELAKLLQEAKRTGREEGAANGSPEIARRLESSEEQHKALLDSVTEFEKASGLRIAFGWQHEKLGKAVKLLLDADYRCDAVEQLRAEAKAMRTTADRVEEQAKAIEKIRAGASEAAE